MKKLLNILIALAISSLAMSQTIELKSNGHAIKLKKIDTLFYAEYSLTSSEKINAKKNEFAAVNLKHAFGKVSKTKPQNAKFISNFYVYEDGTLQSPTSQLFFKPVDIKDFAKKYGYLGIIEEAPMAKGFYYLYVINEKYSTGDGILSLCDKLFTEKTVSIIEPVFNKLLKTQNPLRPIQWNVRNTGVVNGANTAADMGVESAWNFSTGANITVAVIDDGVDFTHPDLQANLLAGFDATGNNSGGAPTPNNAHGTNCAGIIAGVDNNIGIIGVAFNSRIVPIRMGIVDPAIGSFNTNDTWIVNCFNEAVTRGVDIISCSWGGGSPSAQINNAIHNAIVNGRNGRGTLVVFAAGNNNTSITYPATNPEVIAVGASSPCDTRKRSSTNPALVNPGVMTDAEGTSCDGENWWGSNFGTGLDLVAPGVLIPTTDNVGPNGVDFDDYNEDFNGSSAAAPNVAGVLALILSANTNLTGQQARNILEQTCFKVPNGNFQANISGQPNGTWSTQVGYGRIDAGAAVCQAVASNQLAITSSNNNNAICNSATYTLNGPLGTPVNWSVNPGGIVSTNVSGNTITLTRITDGRITLSASVGGGCVNVPSINKQLGVGAPDISLYFPRQNPRFTGIPIQYTNYNYTQEYTIFTNTKPGSTQQWTVSTDDPNMIWSFTNNNQLRFVFSNVGYTAVFNGNETNACGTGSGAIYAKSVGSGGAPGGIQLSGDPNFFTISPNPTTGIIQVNSTTNNGFTMIRVFDKMGNIKMQFSYGLNTTQATINVSSLLPDVYSIQVSFPEASYSKLFRKD